MTLLLSGCFVRKRVVIASVPSPGHPPLIATKEELIRRIHDASDSNESFLMQVTMAASKGGQDHGVIIDYATIGGQILYRRPDQIRVIGQDPLMNTTIFDMVSKNSVFSLHIPSRNRFLVGDNDAPPASKNQWENMRPGAFLRALVIDPPDPDSSLLENDTNDLKAVYILLMIRRDNDQFRLVRNIYFDRYTLDITRQKTFDLSGNSTSETTYSGWKRYGQASFPTNIDIKRPQENFEVQLSVTSMAMNSPNVTPEKFVLDQPTGTQLQQLQ
jgi:hypothetical protein